MTLDELLPKVFVVVFALIVLNLIAQVLRKGLRGAMFGARVASTTGEVDLGRKALMRTCLRVHRLEQGDAAAPLVGLEITSTSVAAFNIRAIPLTREQAAHLGALLVRASE